jgi:hypothetical protein
MSRHRHKPRPDKAAVAERASRRREIAAKLAADSGALADDLRVEQLSWALLRLDSAKHAILHGENVDHLPWQAVVDQMTALLPPKAQELTVRFVDAGYCKKCQADLTSDELAEVEAAHEARQPRKPPALPKADEPVQKNTCPMAELFGSQPEALPAVPAAPAPRSPTPPAPNFVPLHAADGLRYGAVVIDGPAERNPAHGLPMDGRDSWDQRR